MLTYQSVFGVRADCCCILGTGDARTNSTGIAEDEHTSTQAMPADGHQLHSSSSSPSHPPSHSLSPFPQLARHESGRHASTSARATPSHQSHRDNGDGSSLESSAREASQPPALATRQPESAGVNGAIQSASDGRQNGSRAIDSDRSYGDWDPSSVQAGSRDQPQHNSESGNDQAATPNRGGGKESGRTPLAALASSSSNSANGFNSGNSSSHELSQDEGQSGQYQSDEDEVAGALHDEADANGPPARTKDPHYWHEPAVLPAVCGSPSVGAWLRPVIASLVEPRDNSIAAMVLAIVSQVGTLVNPTSVVFKQECPHGAVLADCMPAVKQANHTSQC